MVASETRSQFDKIVMEQLLDFVCDENMILDVLRKCFLYQVSISSKLPFEWDNLLLTSIKLLFW